MGLSDQALSDFRNLSPQELNEWEEAFVAVECYLDALQLRNRVLVAQLVSVILWRAFERREEKPKRPARVIAIEETLAELKGWTQEVLHETFEENRLAARGRLALLLADMPGRWRNVFLTPAPWPEPFTQAMRESYLMAGPQFAELIMNPQPLELNVMGSGAAQAWETMDRTPALRRLAWCCALSALVAFFWFLLIG